MPEIPGNPLLLPDRLLTLICTVFWIEQNIFLHICLWMRPQLYVRSGPYTVSHRKQDGFA